MHLYIDNNLIPENMVLNLNKKIEDKLTYSFSNIIANTFDCDLVLDPIYDNDNPLSIFFSDNWYNYPIALKDDKNLIVWKGRLKNYKKDTKKKTVSLNAVSRLKELTDLSCNLTWGDTDNKTPSEIILKLFVDILKIPSSEISLKSFEQARQIQDNNQGYIQVKYLTEDNIKISSVVSEILRITNSHLYTEKDIIKYYQWMPYTGILGTEILPEDIIESACKTEFDFENIVNNYKIAYNNDGVIGYDYPDDLTIQMVASRNKYGEKYFQVPSEKIDSLEISKYKILVKTKTGATFYGNLALQRNLYSKQLVTLTLTNKRKDLLLREQIDLTFQYNSREPLAVIEKKYDLKKKEVEVKTECLNKPYSYIIRDTTPPIKTTLRILENVYNNKVLLAWDAISDALGYKIYFSNNQVNWKGTYSSIGLSPIIANPAIINERCFLEIPVTENDIYYFYITAYDASFNESLPSNILSILPMTIPYADKQYRADGDLWSGINFDINNINTYPSFIEFNDYNDTYSYEETYGYTGFYLSQIFRSVSEYQNFIFKSSNTQTVIFSREYNNGVFSSWKKEATGQGIHSISVSPDKEIQFVIAFDINDWNIIDDRTIYIKDIIKL